MPLPLLSSLTNLTMITIKQGNRIGSSPFNFSGNPNMSHLELVSESRCFNGWLKRYQHHATSVSCMMQFSIYLPDLSGQRTLPALYWLSGLTCTDQNFMQKSGAIPIASELGIILITPDTSPRGSDFPDEHQDWDFGSGAGFYLNATQTPWDKNYRMYDYVVNELPSIVAKRFPVNSKRSISGHSMGGHGAVICALKNPGFYCSVSAFSPICAPVKSPWGQKAFSNYLGEDINNWNQYDASKLIQHATERLPILIDQGTEDEFLQHQLLPEELRRACEQYQHPLTLRMQTHYDHSYYFISTFIEDHLHHHLYAMENTINC